MRLVLSRFLLYAFSLGLTFACVNPIDQALSSQLDVVVVDGAITDLAELQLIRLSRSKADVLTGRPGSTPLTKAKVEVVVDSTQHLLCQETAAGTYQLPTDFRGQIGHTYQLRFTLTDGTAYQSTSQIMPPAPPIQQVQARFNPTSIVPAFAGTYTGGHDVFIDWQDPANQTNYYRWDWVLYEPQDWCCSCYEGFYAVDSLADLQQNGTFFSLAQPYERCFYPPTYTLAYEQLKNGYLDYPCRTQCWQIIYSHTLNVFSDQAVNGGFITHRSVAHIPFYQHSPCLVNLRQQALTADAYIYFSHFQEQTQNTGGVADVAPTLLPGNVQNLANRSEIVVGYFTASGVATRPYYLDRRDTEGIPPGLFQALNGRDPNPELQPPLGPTLFIHSPSPPRPPTARCLSQDDRTPFKPEGWPN